jgi:tRNA G18 (ribose-2'-O)-methylase SpoU
MRRPWNHHPERQVRWNDPGRGQSLCRGHCSFAATIDLLKKEGIWVYGASGEAKDPIYQLDLDMDLAIVIGAEEKGIRPLVKKKCDRLFSIPMKGPLSSFNASVSGGMILYEVMRQRSQKQTMNDEQ